MENFATEDVGDKDKGACRRGAAAMPVTHEYYCWVSFQFVESYYRHHGALLDESFYLICTIILSDCYVLLVYSTPDSDLSNHLSISVFLFAIYFHPPEL